MTEKKLIQTIDILLTCVVYFVSISVFALIIEPPSTNWWHEEVYTFEELYPNLPEETFRAHNIEQPPTPTPRPILSDPNDILLKMDSIEFTFQTMEFEYVGRHFITAYCPEECGWSWSTSSGATCHWSSDWRTPTTCAIDRSVHNYGEVILVGNPKDPNNRKVYITEDTGPGVKGMWVDCFVETMDEVRRWNTRYDSVYNVYYHDYTISVGDIRHMQEMMIYNDLIESRAREEYLVNAYKTI